MVRKDTKYPFATIALYGPDDKTTTKIVVGIYTEENKEPILRRWVSSKFSTDDKAKAQIKEFLLQYKVTQSIMTEGNIGCIHEEGLDFPVGEDCPFCPFWKDKQ